MIIKKFKNGNININLENSDKFYYSNSNSKSYKECLKCNIDTVNIYNIYNDFIIMHDLYFEQINDYSYLVDFNTSKVYDISYSQINILQELKNNLVDAYNKKQKYKLYPLSNKECKSLMKNLNNEY